MTEQTSRRTFLASSAIAASTIVDRHVLGAPFTAPSDKTELLPAILSLEKTGRR